MALVFAAIAPHGGLAIEEACTPEERGLAAATRAGMVELGRLFAAARPQAVVVATPHNVHIPASMGVIVSGRMAGQLAGAPPSIALDVPTELTLAWLLLKMLLTGGVPSSGISFGGNDPVEAVAPMDWGVLIPLWFMGGRFEPPVPVVVMTPARDLSAERTTSRPEPLSPRRPAHRGCGSRSSPAPTTGMPTTPRVHTASIRRPSNTTS